jgi:hypothetical protein
MSTILDTSSVLGGSTAVMLQGSNALRFAPQPRNSLDFAGNVGKAFSAVASTAAGVVGLGGMTDIPGLLNKQMEIQVIMQLVSMESNISRTEMAPIRNMRVG